MLLTFFKYSKLGIFVVILIIAGGSLSSGLTITEVSFYPDKSLDVNRKITGTVGRNKLQKLYARFTLIGGEESIEDLDKDGFLTVTVDWLLNDVVVAVVEIGITQERWGFAEDDLKNQVNQNSFFAYRTTTFKSYIPPGEYTLIIRDKHGNPLSPSGHDGLYKPRIKVTLP